MKTNRGFTLVETLVAIGILSLSLAGTFTAAQNGLQNSTFAKDQVTASYLAQEAIEYIKNIRDQNSLASLKSQAAGSATVNWLTGLSAQASDPCYFGKTCTIDAPLGNVTTCSGGWGSCPVLLQKPDNPNMGLFGYTAGWTATKFKREIQFQSLGANEVMVTISMSWTSGSYSKTVRVTEDLFNQQ